MEFGAFRDRTDLFDGVAAIVEANASLTTPGDMEPLLHLVRFDRQLLSREIVGVVRHLQTQGLRSAGLPQIWMTYATRSPAQLNAVVRAEAPLLLVPAIDRGWTRSCSGLTPGTR